MNKRPRFLLRVLCTAIFFVSTIHWLLRPIPAAQTAAPKYIFLFLADGGGIPHMEITRQYNRLIHNEGLVITDKIIKEGTLGLMTTHAADTLSTDSAAAATAMASGCKANVGALGICADGTVPKTVMELAKQQGRRIGFVTTATVYDASPAAFVSHVRNRRDYAAIVDGYLRFEPEVLFGGGRDQFLAHDEPGSRRKDGRNIIQAFRDKGYGYAATKEHLAQLKGRKALGLFTLEDMSFEIDRDDKVEPSLSDMTRAAIRVLEEDASRGFILFIENENIDTAGHFNDVAAMIRDYREFDRAVGLAYDFYRRYPGEALIIVTADHETGGLGFVQALKDLSSTGAKNRLAATAEDLKKLQSIRISLRKAAAILGTHPTEASVDRLMAEHFKGFVLAPEYKQAILKRQLLSRTNYIDPVTVALGLMVANNTQAYWLTTAHTNQPTMVAALGVGAELFRGYLDNADFGKTLKALLEGKQTP
ncbi:MAG: alkaline phosphatase [Deltaproteobacteria bacterium]|nr:alkaline phosphatase [Deltaproteobacteria bacterium]MDZ4343640.1 alkaline phosphatase [Candidatus Binatia bacterium]